MYALRYTSDLHIIRTADVAADLAAAAIYASNAGYKVHIIDLNSMNVVWQNSKSERYGSRGV